MFYRLEALLDTIIAEAGGKKVASFEFMYRGDNLSLQWKEDIYEAFGSTSWRVK